MQNLEEVSSLEIVTLSKPDYYILITTLAMYRSLSTKRVTKRLLNVIKKIVPNKIARIETNISARREIPLKKLVKNDSVHLMDITTADNSVYEVHVHRIKTTDDKRQFILYVTTIRRA